MQYFTLIKNSIVCTAFLVLTTTFAHAKALTIYSGRSERLIGPILKQFEKDSGIKLNIRYGKTPQLAAAIMEEEKNSPTFFLLKMREL